MIKRIPAMIAIAVLWVWVICSLPMLNYMMLIGGVFLAVWLPWMEWKLWKRARNQDALKPVSAEVFENPRRRKLNRFLHLTTFAQELSDGSRVCRTVYDGSARYREYMALRKS